MKYLMWFIKAALFFTLFAFALNNQQEVTVKFFFGAEWRARMVLVVLAVFVIGLIVGVLSVLPRYWRSRRQAEQAGGNTTMWPAER